MKIAIKGDTFRGKEVIQILKSLGGKSTFTTYGFNEHYCYYVNSNGIIIESLITTKTRDEFNLYTLEEFETQFPFKVGDLCIYYSDILGENIVVRILGMTIENDCIMYEVGHRDITKGHSHIYRKIETLKPYKEMKEERNITLTLDKAKEWYKKGGELKEIALQAFTEKELNPLPRSWEEFCKRGNPVASCRYTIPTKYEALFKLEQLRNCWWNGWKPEYNCGTKYIIKWDKDDLIVTTSGRIRAFLIFPTYEMAKEFLECFRDLIEKAGDLI